MQNDQIALRVTFKECILGNARNPRTPDGLEMSRHFGQGVGEAVFAFFVLYHADALHEIGDGDEVACYRYVDGCR